MDLTKLTLFLSGLATLAATKNVTTHPGRGRMYDSRGGREPRVIGGRTARLREFPWMVSLHYKGEYFCSSFLVTPKYLMTAAHCVYSGRRLNDPKLYKGYADTINRDGPGRVIKFNEIFAHSEISSLLGQFDIALLKLTKPVKLGRGINPICLPSKGSNYEDFSVRIMGWGYADKRSREMSKVLQTVLEKVYANSYCFDTYSKLNITLPSGKSVCAGGTQDQGLCHGDSGGPLVAINNNRPVAIGVASHGSPLGCASKHVPAIFTDTTVYTDWMKEKMGDDAKELCFL